MNKLVPLVLLIVGCLVLAVSSLYYAANGLPDPTVELVENA